MKLLAVIKASSVTGPARELPPERRIETSVVSHARRLADLYWEITAHADRH